EEVRRRLAPFLPGSTAARPLGPWESRGRKVPEKGGAGGDRTGPTEPPSACTSSSAYSTRAHTATPGTLRARMASAQARADVGQYVMAALELRELLPDLVATFGPEHPDTLRARRRKAYAIGKSGQHLDATRKFGALVDNLTRVYGASHPETLTARYYR